MRLIRGLARRWGFRGDAAVVLIGAALISSIFLMRKARHLPPDKQLSVIRIQIVQTVKDVEAAKDIGLLDDVLYTRSKNQVLKAARLYNVMMRRYERYGKIARSEKQQVVALLAAAAQTVRGEIKRKRGR